MRLNTGELALAKAGEELYTGGVGSCVVACLWHRVERRGGMAHMSSPTASGDILNPGRSPDTALPHLKTQLLRLGPPGISGIEVIFVGGGNMFPGMEESPMLDIGRRIFDVASEVARHQGLNIRQSCLGRLFGCNVNFNPDEGTVLVRYTNGEEVPLSF